MSLSKRLRYIYLSCDWVPEELLSSVLAAAFGFWILLVARAVTLPLGATVVTLQTLLPLWIWGMIGFGVCAWGHLAAFHGDWRLRATAAGLRFIYWSFLVLLTLLNYTPTAQTAIFGVLSLSSAWAVWKTIGQVHGAHE